MEKQEDKSKQEGKIFTSIAIGIIFFFILSFLKASFPANAADVTVLMASPASQTVQAGQSFNVTFNWQGGPTDVNMVIPVHFVNDSGETAYTVFSGDHGPPDYLTSQWSGNISYARTIIVPSGIPSGTYKIWIGFWKPGVGWQPLTAGPGVVAIPPPDGLTLHYEVGTVTVVLPPTADHKVSTIHFSIWVPHVGSVGSEILQKSAWIPKGGWVGYNSLNSAVMAREIKDMMSANIDTVFEEMSVEGGDPSIRYENYPYNNPPEGISCVTPKPVVYSQELLPAIRNFFSSYRSLFEAGYRPPKISEWANHEGLNRFYCAYGHRLDLSDENDREYYYNTLIKPFWTAYFDVLGPHADAAMEKRDGKAVISLDSLIDYRETGISDDFFQDLKSRFKAEFGYDLYLMAPPGYGDQYPSVDETHNAFGPIEFYKGGKDGSGHNTIEVIPGFCSVAGDYNPGYGRNGDTRYASQWNEALSYKSQVNYLGITSWNYNPEGSNISDSETQVNSNTVNWCLDEVWGSSSSRHYINLTANYAAQWNDIAGNDADFISQDIPSTMIAERTYPITVTFRNTGDNKWTGAGDYKLGLISDVLTNPENVAVNDSEDEISAFEGIFRGRPKTFSFNFTAPSQPGYYSLSWRMKQGSSQFGDVSPQTNISIDNNSGPNRIGVAPSGAVPLNTKGVTLSLETDRDATCRYSTEPENSFENMRESFSTTGEKVHSAYISGLTNGREYHFYVRCEDKTGRINADDYHMSFYVESYGSGVTLRAGNKNYLLAESGNISIKSKSFSFRGKSVLLKKGFVYVLQNSRVVKKIKIKKSGAWSGKIKVKKGRTYRYILRYYDRRKKRIFETSPEYIVSILR